MLNPKIIKKRTHNTIWRCSVCEIWHSDADSFRLVTAALGFILQQNELGLQQAVVPICDPCFEMLDLKDTESKLIIPERKIQL